MKIMRSKTLFIWLLLFVSTTSPLIIEEITDEEVIKDNRNPESNSNISKKSSKELPQSDSHSIAKKMGKNSHRTKTEPPVQEVIDTPRMTYLDTWISGLNQSDLEEILHALIANNSTEKFTIPHYYNDNIPSAAPINKNNPNTTKLSLENKNHTDKPSEHSNAQSIRHRLAKLNKKLINPWGPPIV